jgi:hypothetical protein
MQNLSMGEAWTVFNKTLLWDMVSWSVIILEYVSCRQRRMAVQVLQQILHESVQPKRFHVCGSAKCMCHCSGTQKRPCMLMGRSFKAFKDRSKWF